MLIHDAPPELDFAESVAQFAANTRAMAGKSKLERQDELEDAELAQGRQYHAREFIRLLQLCCPLVLVKDGLPGYVAVYRPRRNDESTDEMDPRRPDWYREHVYVTGFKSNSSLNEYSSVTTDELGRPRREDRGWRTVLISLIKSRCITYRDVTRVFGEPTHSRGWRWHKELATNKG